MYNLKVNRITMLVVVSHELKYSQIYKI